MGVPMALRYTATIYCNDKEIAHQDGNDVDELHAWMLAKSEGKFGGLHGEVTDKKSGESIRSFKKAPPD